MGLVAHDKAQAALATSQGLGSVSGWELSSAGGVVPGV